MSIPIDIRAYNVRFGDAILMSLGRGTSAKHVLFDFGNAPGGVRNQGGRNDVFEEIATDLRAQTGGRLDVVVVTHEHLDHMEGFYSQSKIFDRMDIGQVWMSIMSEPDYYRTHERAKPQKTAREALAGRMARWSAAGRLGAMPDAVQRLIENNNVLELSNVERLKYVKALAPTKYMCRAPRGTGPRKVTGHRLGDGIAVEILAPEEDASVYYPNRDGSGLLEAAARLGPREDRRRRRREPGVPSNMARDEFEQLKDDIAQVDMASVFAIDKAANNTSLVVRLTVEGKVLMFCGDAEVESWRVMKEKGLLEPVDVLKIAHHGSVNGMPFEGADSVVDRLLKPGKQTTAIVSTCRGAYPASSRATEIPSAGLMRLLRAKCKEVVDTEQDAVPGQAKVVTVQS